MNSVFLDTVGLIARWDRHDQWHAAAKAKFSELVRIRARFVTTTFVFTNDEHFRAAGFEPLF
jgi:hypothetical protein